MRKFKIIINEWGKNFLLTLIVTTSACTLKNSVENSKSRKHLSTQSAVTMTTKDELISFNLLPVEEDSLNDMQEAEATDDGFDLIDVVDVDDFDLIDVDNNDTSTEQSSQFSSLSSSSNSSSSETSTATSSMSSSSTSSSNSAVSTVNYLNQRWVGYWGAALNGAGKGNYIAETASVSNVIMIRDDSIQGWKQKLQEAKDHNLKAILMVTNVFFPWASSVLKTNYVDSFDSYWESLKDYQDIVVGFYVYDEPFWVNVSAGWVTVPNATLKASLVKVIDYLHNKLPGRFTALSYSYVELENPNFANAFLPDNVDMWGVNCYLPGCTDAKLVSYWNKMLATLKPNQKLLVTLDSYWGSNPGVWQGYWPETVLIERLRKWKSLISANQDKVMGVFPFLYQSVPSENLYGVESMPNVKAEYDVYMEALQGKLRCGANSLFRVNAEGEIMGEWVSAPMCVPKCEGKNYVRRDVLGNLLGVWYNAPAPYCY